MKGLIFAFGLIPALFIFNVQATIYDNASYLTPNITDVNNYYCTAAMSLDDCKNKLKSAYLTDVNENNSTPHALSSCYITQVGLSGYFYCSDTWETGNNPSLYLGEIYGPITETSTSCPPDENLTYTFDRDTNNDGKIDQCYNPLELDQLSNCSAAANGGKILPVGGNTASKVCAVNDDGTSCGFAQVTAGNSTYYAVDLEMNCFGDSDFPEYDPDAAIEQPQDEQCTPYGDGFACSADPSNTCDASGVCPENCGYVNDQFICFRDEECSGSSCENPTVTDPDNPDPDNPDPDNPDPTDPDACVGDDCTSSSGSGGSSFVFDYDKMKLKIDESLESLVDENEMDDGKTTQDEISDNADEMASKYDDFASNPLFDEIINKPEEGVFDGMKNMLPSGGSCTSYSFGKVTLDFCSLADRLRPILSFVFAFLTLIYLRSVFFNTIKGNE